MANLLEIKPKEPRRVMDLVDEAGVDISDWANFRKGPDFERAASNPKYCYEWAFVEKGKVVVLNLWYEHMREKDGIIFHEDNVRQFGVEMGSRGRPILEMRAARLDLALQVAVRGRLPLRVIVIDGDIRDTEDPKSGASHVQNRFLDPVPWAITTYDMMTGKSTITRGVPSGPYVDQFDIQELSGAPQRKSFSGEGFARERNIRKQALERAGGKCEYCGTSGFVMAGGLVYLESHHVIPLSEGGLDALNNVTALCPNHHREAHYGNSRKEIREALLLHLHEISDQELTNGKT